MKTKALMWVPLAFLSALFIGCDADLDGTPVAGEIDARSAASPAAENEIESRLIVVDLMSFRGPEGWHVYGDLDQTMVRAFVDPDGTRDAPNAKITIRRTRAAQPDLDALAQDVADNLGGVVLDDELRLDRSPARVVEVAHPGDGLHPVRAVVSRYFIEQVVIELAVTPEYSGDIDGPIAEVLESWHWMRGGGAG